VGLDAGAAAQLLGDALGPNCGLVVHPPGPGHTGEHHASLFVAEHRGPDRVLFPRAGNERLAARPSGLWAADLHIGAVKA